MSLASQIIQGSISALNLIKSYLSNPSISFDAGNGSGIPIIDTTKSVPIQAAEYKEVGDTDISSQLIVSNDKTGQADGKGFVTDNIAPRPRVWEIRGYIGASILEQLATPVLQFVQAQRLNLLREMRMSRKMLVFRTNNGEELVYVGMKHLEITTDPAIQNRIPISMTLQEVPIVTFNNGAFGIPAGSSNQSAAALAIGVTTGIAIDLAATIGSSGDTVESLILKNKLATQAELDAANVKTVQDAFNAAIPKPEAKSVASASVVPIPNVATGSVSFNFSSRINGLSLDFQFKWINSSWKVFVTFPDTSIRQASLSPNATNWTGFDDYGLICLTPLDNVGLNDIPNTTLMLIEWQ